MNLTIFKLLLTNKTVYDKYHKIVNKLVNEQEVKELKILFQGISLLHGRESEESNWSVDDLSLCVAKAYPSVDSPLLRSLLDQLVQCTADGTLMAEYLESLRIRTEAHKIAVEALKVFETGSDTIELKRRLESLNTGLEIDSETDVFVSSDLQLLKELRHDRNGLRWRLNSLNKMLGSLRKGDFGVIFARPETGKTTLLASEISYMAEQADRPILWINNEEDGGQVMTRVYQASLGLTLEELYSNVEVNKSAFIRKTGGRIKLYDAVGATQKQLNKVVQDLNPCLIIIDQIDKVNGFEADRYDLKMKAIYQWAREVAKGYGAVIGVCQANGQANDKKWLGMTDMDSSMTAKQGECDFILGIGKVGDEAMDRVRFLHLCKNKLQGDKDTDPNRRHGKAECLIRADVARYEDFN